MADLIDWAGCSAHENAVITLRAKYGAEGGKVDGYYDLHPQYVYFLLGSVRCGIESFADYHKVEISEAQKVEAYAAILRKNLRLKVGEYYV